MAPQLLFPRSVNGLTTMFMCTHICRHSATSKTHLVTYSQKDSVSKHKAAFHSQEIILEWGWLFLFLHSNQTSFTMLTRFQCLSPSVLIWITLSQINMQGEWNCGWASRLWLCFSTVHSTSSVRSPTEKGVSFWGNKISHWMNAEWGMQTCHKNRLSKTMETIWKHCTIAVPSRRVGPIPLLALQRTAVSEKATLKSETEEQRLFG